MEENTVELIDYFRVIWKRKILIIVVILVCIGIGVGVKVKNSMRPKLPPVTSYIADTIVKIGKKMKLVLSERYSSSVVEYIENPKDMLITIPLLYNLNVKGASGYHLDVEKVGAYSMLKLTLKGPDTGVERVLGELVDMLLDKHRMKVEDSVIAYNNFMERLEADAIILKGNIHTINTVINEMKKREGEYLVRVDRPGADLEEGIVGGDRSAYLNMLYLKSVDKQKDLNNTWKDLRAIQRQLIMHQITLGNLEEYKTEVVSEVKSAAIYELNKKKEKRDVTILVAGVVGLILSLFLVILIEYLVKEKEKEKARVRGKG